MKWREKAACRDEDPELFFPAGNWSWGRAAKARRRRVEASAKAICRSCEVRDDCLRYALDERADHGIWAGLNEDERKQIRGRT